MATPTRAKQALGEYLQALRDARSIEIEDAFGHLKTTRSTLTRYESGNVLPAWGTVLALLDLYKATAKQREEALRLYDVAADEPPPVRLPAGAPKAFKRLVNAERDCKLENVIESRVPPGLLQTPAFMHAINSVATRYMNEGNDVRGYANRRLNRQKRLEGPNPIALNALIDEAALGPRVIGSHAIMHEQLDHLLTMGERPNITIRIIPYTAGAYGTMSGSCAIVVYPDDVAAVYLEYPAGASWVENDKDVRRFTTMFDDVAQIALPPDESARLIWRHARALEE